jgi:hypothetical protein
MLSYWLSTPLEAWVPLVLAVVFALASVVAIVATVARRTEERDASGIAILYGLGFGLVAVSELLMYLDVAFGWSLATFFAISASVATSFAIGAAVVAGLAIIIALIVQVREEGMYRAHHGYVH